MGWVDFPFSLVHVDSCPNASPSPPTSSHHVDASSHRDNITSPLSRHLEAASLLRPHRLVSVVLRARPRAFTHHHNTPLHIHPPTIHRKSFLDRCSGLEELCCDNPLIIPSIVHLFPDSQATRLLGYTGRHCSVAAVIRGHQNTISRENQKITTPISRLKLNYSLGLLFTAIVVLFTFDRVDLLNISRLRSVHQIHHVPSNLPILLSIRQSLDCSSSIPESHTSLRFDFGIHNAENVSITMTSRFERRLLMNPSRRRQMADAQANGDAPSPLQSALPPPKRQRGRSKANAKSQSQNAPEVQQTQKRKTKNSLAAVPLEEPGSITKGPGIVKTSRKSTLTELVNSHNILPTSPSPNNVAPSFVKKAVPSITSPYNFSPRAGSVGTTSASSGSPVRPSASPRYVNTGVSPIGSHSKASSPQLVDTGVPPIETPSRLSSSRLANTGLSPIGSQSEPSTPRVANTGLSPIGSQSRPPAPRVAKTRLSPIDSLLISTGFPQYVDKAVSPVTTPFKRRFSPPKSPGSAFCPQPRGTSGHRYPRQVPYQEKKFVIVQYWPDLTYEECRYKRVLANRKPTGFFRLPQEDLECFINSYDENTKSLMDVPDSPATQAAMRKKSQKRLRIKDSLFDKEPPAKRLKKSGDANGDAPVPQDVQADRREQIIQDALTVGNKQAGRGAQANGRKQTQTVAQTNGYPADIAALTLPQEPVYTKDGRSILTDDDYRATKYKERQEHQRNGSNFSIHESGEECSPAPRAWPLSRAANYRLNVPSGPPGITERATATITRYRAKTAERKKREMEARRRSSGPLEETNRQSSEPPQSRSEVSPVEESEASTSAQESSGAQCPVSTAQTVPETAEPSAQPFTFRPPETPRRGWGLASLRSIPGSVTRFIPGGIFGRQQASNPPALPTSGAPAQTSGQSAQTSELHNEGREIDELAQAQEDSTILSSPILLTIGQAALNGKRTPLPAKSRRQKSGKQKVMSEDDERRISEEVQRQVNAILRSKGIELDSDGKPIIPGTEKKRKRKSSPEVIPNPEGVSYGMDMDYFACSSDDDDEENDSARPNVFKDNDSDGRKRVSSHGRASPESPTPKRRRLVESHPADSLGPVEWEETSEDEWERSYPGFATKEGREERKRLYSGHPATPENPTRPSPSNAHTATPYTGKLFPEQEKSTVFKDGLPEATDSTLPEEKDSPEGFGFSYSDDESSSFEEPEPPSPIDPVAPLLSAKGILQAPSASPKHVAVDTAGTHQKQKKKVRIYEGENPPPPPTPAHAVLPESEALAKARAKATQYTPKQPSGLRAASRLSSSSVGSSSDIGALSSVVIPEDNPRSSGIPKDIAHTSGNPSNAAVNQPTSRLPHPAFNAPSAPTNSAELRDVPEIDPEVIAAIAAIPEADIPNIPFPIPRSVRGVSNIPKAPKIVYYSDKTSGPQTISVEIDVAVSNAVNYHTMELATEVFARKVQEKIETMRAG